jgi:MoaA/NifB/PqqE/SkfB family radical SAM enzyme
MIIKDPQNLLPYSLKFNQEFSHKLLEIPPHGVPLHADSIERLLALGKSTDKPIGFKPILPISSEIGLPSYPVLAYLYSQEDCSKQLPFTIISDLNQAEQLHYFADHYGTIIKPPYVRVVVGNTCNLKCIMCPYHSSVLKPTHTTEFFQGNKAMSWGMMERLAKDCGEAKLSILIGSVEEPLLHPKLVDFIQLCRKLGVPKIHLTTNGQLLNETYASALLSAGLTSIDISIDAATPETYAKVRGADFDRVESNVINFIRLRNKLGISCEVRTSFVRNQNTSLEEEKKFINYWLSKINSIFILNVAEYQENNMRLKKNNESVENSLQYYLDKAQGRWACLFPFIEMAVLPDGRIYYCIETLFRLGFDQDIQSLGDYNQQNLQEIWSGDLFRQLRQDLILNQLEKRTACKDCDMWMSQVINRETKDGYQVLSTSVTEIYSQA